MPRRLQRWPAGPLDSGLDAWSSSGRAFPTVVTLARRMLLSKTRRLADQPYGGRPCAAGIAAAAAVSSSGWRRSARRQPDRRMFTGAGPGTSCTWALLPRRAGNQPISVDAAMDLRQGTVGSPHRYCGAPPGNAPYPSTDTCCPVGKPNGGWAPITSRVGRGPGWVRPGRSRCYCPAQPEFEGPQAAVGHGVVAGSVGCSFAGCYHPTTKNMFTGRPDSGNARRHLREAQNLAGIVPSIDVRGHVAGTTLAYWLGQMLFRSPSWSGTPARPGGQAIDCGGRADGAWTAWGCWPRRGSAIT